uniref:Uncharacterized protein n=1 Tax=Rhizophora mucronata TaxID=61149 RepID=A0A2P2LK44_RHIMU
MYVSVFLSCASQVASVSAAKYLNWVSLILFFLNIF